jgi:alpha-ketoglutarate-dependent taurine dioxygenase
VIVLFLLAKLEDRPMAEPLKDRRIWSRESIDPARNWYFAPSSSCWALLAEYHKQMAGADKSDWMHPPPHSLIQSIRAELQPVREELEHGRGFAIITGLPASLSIPEKEHTYWLTGHGLGLPVVQNVQGVLLYDVRDTGQDVRQGARFSVTNSESSFHTDNSFGLSVVDYVGLLCLQTARSGGVSQMVNGFRVAEELAKKAPEHLAVLQREFQFDRRGGVRPGETETVAFPVLERRPDDWVCRYLRFWIEAGHQKAMLPLTVKQQQALDELDLLLGRPELRVEFELRPDDMYFLNNRWIFHNRTAFEDHRDPERRRHLVRLWLQA